jgi:hypothetical protein
MAPEFAASEVLTDTDRASFIKTRLRHFTKPNWRSEWPVSPEMGIFDQNGLAVAITA